MEFKYEVIYSPFFVAKRLNLEAQKISKNYEVRTNDNEEFVIYEAEKPVYVTDDAQHVQVLLDRIRITRNFQNYGK